MHLLMGRSTDLPIKDLARMSQSTPGVKGREGTGERGELGCSSRIYEILEFL